MYNLARLHEAYQRLCRLAVAEPGSYVAPIVEVLLQVALLRQATSFRNDPRDKHYRSYSRVAFSYQLGRLVQRRLGDQELILHTDLKPEDRLTGGSGRDLFYDGLGDILTDVKTLKDAETVL